MESIGKEIIEMEPNLADMNVSDDDFTIIT